MGHLLQRRHRHTAAARPSSAMKPSASVPLGIKSYEGLPAFGLLQHAAQAIPDREAIRYGDQSWNYAQLNEDSIRCAAMLQRIGVHPGDRVGILLPNVPEYVIAANAIWRAGGVAIAISPLMVAEEVQSLVRATGCRLVVCLDMLAHLVSGAEASDSSAVGTLLVSIRQHLPALQQLGYLWARHSRTGHWTLPETPHCRWLWNEMETTDRNWQPISIDPVEDPAYIIPTGGTTAAPKAVTLSHQGMVANAWQQYEWTERSFAEEKMLAVLPFFHSYGMSATVMAGAAMGATLVLHHRFNTRQTIRLISQHRPTVFHAVPAMLDAMNERLRAHPADLSSLRWVISGGAPLEESIGSEFARNSGALVVEGYGLSEASPVTHVGHLFQQPRYGSIGMPLPETECRIVQVQDQSTEGLAHSFDRSSEGLAHSFDRSERGEPVDVEEGQVGELIVRGPQLMLGYWNDRAATAQAIRGGWLHTGDLAVKEDDVYRIVGRKKDLIITSGFNVYPREVEEVLRQCDDVLDAAVVGQPDPHRGEVVKAFIVLKPGATWNERQLHEHCQNHLSKQKRPRVFERCHGDLPRNFLGKVIRRHLREADSDSPLAVNQEVK